MELDIWYVYQKKVLQAYAANDSPLQWEKDRNKDGWISRISFLGFFRTNHLPSAANLGWNVGQMVYHNMYTLESETFPTGIGELSHRTEWLVTIPKMLPVPTCVIKLDVARKPSVIVLDVCQPPFRGPLVDSFTWAIKFNWLQITEVNFFRSSVRDFSGYQSQGRGMLTRGF